MKEVVAVLSAIILGITILTLLLSIIVYILFRLRLNRNKKEVEKEIKTTAVLKEEKLFTKSEELNKEKEENYFIRYQPEE